MYTFAYLGMQQIVIIMVIALLIFGPQKVPELGRQIGGALRDLKKMSNEVQSAFDLDDHHSYDRYEPPTYEYTPPVSSYHEPLDQYGHTPELEGSHAVAEHAAETPAELTPVAGSGADTEPLAFLDVPETPLEPSPLPASPDPEPGVASTLTPAENGPEQAPDTTTPAATKTERVPPVTDGDATAPIV